MNQINEHIKEHETRTWLNDIDKPESKRGNGRNKLRTYKLFKQTYSEEIYVKLIMQRSHRSSFANGVSPLSTTYIHMNATVDYKSSFN